MMMMMMMNQHCGVRASCRCRTWSFGRTLVDVEKALRATICT